MATYLNLLIFSLIANSPLFGSEAYRIDVSQVSDRELLSDHIKYFESKDESLSLDRILKSGNITFKTFEKGKYVLPPTEKYIWIRLRFSNSSDREFNRVLTSLITEAAHFTVWKVRGETIESIGAFGFKDHDDQNVGSYPRVPLTFAAHDTFDLWIKSKQQRFDAYLLHLQTPQKDHERFMHVMTFLSIYTGCMLGLGLYNLFLFLSLRDPAYLWYVSFAACMVISVTLITRLPDGVGFRLGNTGIFIGIVFLSLIPASALMFCRYFLKTWTLSQRLDSSIKILFLLCLLTGLGVAITGSDILVSKIQILNIITLVLVVISGVLSIRSGFTPAYYYLTAWGIFLIAVIIWTAAHKNIIVVSYINTNASIAGNMIEMILMSFALGQRIKVLEKEKMAAMRKAEEGAAYQQLVRLLCHDIANPVAVIIGFAKRALAKETDEKKIKYLDKINHASKMISDMIETVRLLERNKYQESEVALREVSLIKAFDEVQFLFNEKMADKKIDLVFEGDFSVEVLAQENILINQIFNNIISNAIKFSHLGGRITIRVKSDRSRVYLDIEDQGIGIPSEILPKIFDPENKTSRPGTLNEMGTGFGLPLVKNYVETFGGTIQVFSQEKKGSDKSGTRFALSFRKPIRTQRTIHI